MKHRTTFILAALLTVMLTASGFQDSPQYKILFEKAKFTMETKGDLNGAITLFNEIIKKYPKEREYAAKSQLNIGLCYEKLGANQAQKAYQTVVDTWPDQTELVALAKTKLTQLNGAAAESTLKAEQSFKVAGDLYKEFKYESAITEYENVIRLSPKSRLAEESRLWIGQCNFKLGKYDQALASFNTIKKDYPQSTIVPLTELLISQTRQAIALNPNKKAFITLDNKTILDPNTGIRYTMVNSWAGKNDQITEARWIDDIAPNRQYLIAENKIFPFDNSDPVNLSEDSLNPWITSRLSHDGTKIAFMTKNALSVIPVSPMTGIPSGPSKIIVDKGDFGSPNSLTWSPDGMNLVYSVKGVYRDASLWMVSIKDGISKQITNSFTYGGFCDPVFTMNGINILYKQGAGELYPSLKMISPIIKKSVTILDSCWFNHPYILSPDNHWILYHKTTTEQVLFRLSDKQKRQISPPEEVGSLVSWSDKGSKVYFYKPSYDYPMTSRVISTFGGPAFEMKSQSNQTPFGWSTTSDTLIVSGKDDDGNKCLLMINLTNQESKVIEGTLNPGLFPSFSPDCSKLVFGMKYQMSPTDLQIMPVSLKEGKSTGKPILLFKNFIGYVWDYAWSHDGKKVAVATDGKIWICSADGGAPVQLTKAPAQLRFPKWSPNNNTIAVSTIGTGPMHIIRASDGELLKTYEKVYDYDWTSGNDEIILAHESGEISAVNLTSGVIRKIANWKQLCSEIQYLKCSPDGKWIGLNGYNNDNESYFKIFKIKVADGKVFELATDDPMNKELMIWSPDSKWIAYYYYGSKKTRLEGTLWEADLTDFMKTMKPGTETGYTTETDINALAAKFPEVRPDGSFTDARDGHVYKYKNIGEQTWMAENLAYLPEVYPDSSTSSDSKRYYVYGFMDTDVTVAKNTENYQKYGVLYNWTAAMNGASSSKVVPSGVQGACPSEWHVPSDAEWMILEKMLGMSETDLVKEGGTLRPSGSVNNKLRSPHGWGDADISNGESGFNALPGGMVMRRNSMALNQTAYFWTSTAYNDTSITARLLSRTSSDGIYRNTIGKALGHSLRCIKDK